MNILEHESVASEWLSGIDLAGRTVTVVITGVEEVTVPEPRTGKTIRKVAVAFKGARKRLLLNATNAKALAKLFGLETDNWAGKGVQLRPETVAAFGQQHCVVRVAGAAPMKMAKPEAPAEPVEAAA
jgi:hypothetical protein